MEIESNKATAPCPELVAYEFDTVLENLFEGANVEDTDEKARVCDVLGQLNLCEHKMFGIDGAHENSQRHVYRSTRALLKLSKKHIYASVGERWEAEGANRRSVMMLVSQPTGPLYFSMKGNRKREVVEAFYAAAIETFKGNGSAVTADAINEKLREVMTDRQDYVCAMERPRGS